MSFIFNGLRIEKSLTKEQRDALVEDRYQRTDPATKVTSVFRRVTYYDTKRQFNVYVTQQKIGVIDPATGEVVPVKSRKGNFKRRGINAPMTDTFTQATEGLTDEQYANRMILREAMIRHGFRPLETEWWHFTLENEPYPDTYFDFHVNAEVVSDAGL